MEGLLRLTVSDVQQSFRKLPASSFPRLFQPQLHPRYTALLKEGEAWAERCIAPVLPTSLMQKLRSTNSVKLACYMWPNAEGPRALTLIKFAYWLLIFDDFTDDPALGISNDPDRLQRFCRHFLHAVLGGGDSHAISGFTEQELLPVELGREWWGEMTRSGTETMMPVAQQARVAEGVTAFVMAQLPCARLRSEWEEWLDEATRGKAAAAPCSLEELVRLWRDASCLYLVMVLKEYELGIELDEQSLSNPVLQQIIDATTDHITWVNNIFSFPKDMQKEEILNFLALMHLGSNSNRSSEMPLPFHVTLAQAWDVVAALERNCAHLTTRITQQSPTSLQARKYADALCTATRSHVEWCLQTTRYPHTRPPQKPLFQPAKIKAVSHTHHFCISPPIRLPLATHRF